MEGSVVATTKDISGIGKSGKALEEKKESIAMRLQS